ncbi:hypothetical protein NR756_10625 [Alloalcanivorax xenomutans]|uniref:hypothetical protein n=1 Tax=Alloalcanivorax xenomutans TaxID=1094342 RepID=UPI003A7FFF14
MTPFIRTLALLLGLILTGPALAQMSIHVIQRADAEALVPIIEPLLPEGGSVNAYQGRLVIRTSQENFDQILNALGDMPAAPRTVSVVLRRRQNSEGDDRVLKVEGGRVTVSGGRHRQQREDQYRINTLSGHPASVGQGTLIALAGSQLPALLSLKQGIDILPLLTADNQVRLRISQRFEQLSHGIVADTQSTATTLQVPLGQWTPLGNIEVREQTRSQGLGGAEQRSSTVTLPLEIKVDLVH